MTYQFEATVLDFSEDEDSLTVGFGGMPEESGQPTVYLLVQRSTNPNEDEPGMEGVYTEWNDHFYGGYNTISAFILKRHAAKVVFTEDARLEQDGEKLTELHILINLEDDRYTELRQKLTDVIFLDCPEFSVLE